MNVLSLFDGIGCGRLALDRAGVVYDSYYASEIDEKAIRVMQATHPDTKQLGDVTQVSASSLPRVDLILGGSPCQGLSSVGKGLGLDDPRSVLFWQFVRLLEECQPRYWLLENVKMRADWQQIITDALGVPPMPINSSLVSAQNRLRLYWTNIPWVTQPADRGITLDDVIEGPDEYRLVGGDWRKRVPPSLPRFVDPFNHREITRGKSNTLRTNIANGNMWIRVPDGYRNLTVTECERLQTVPVDYTSSVTDNQAKQLLGNAWTVDVIAHIVAGLPSVSRTSSVGRAKNPRSQWNVLAAPHQ